MFNAKFFARRSIILKNSVKKYCDGKQTYSSSVGEELDNFRLPARQHLLTLCQSTNRPNTCKCQGCLQYIRKGKMDWMVRHVWRFLFSSHLNTQHANKKQGKFEGVDTTHQNHKYPHAMKSISPPHLPQPPPASRSPFLSATSATPQQKTKKRVPFLTTEEGSYPHQKTTNSHGVLFIVNLSPFVQKQTYPPNIHTKKNKTKRVTPFQRRGKDLPYRRHQEAEINGYPQRQ